MKFDYIIEFPNNGPVCAISSENNKIIDAAPVVRWTIGKSLEEVMTYFDKRKCKVTMINFPII